MQARGLTTAKQEEMWEVIQNPVLTAKRQHKFILQNFDFFT